MLIDLFNKGDETAFKKLFYEFFKPACAFVKRYISDDAIVEDVVQETFIHIWEKRGIYTDMLYFKAYLYKSLRNNALYYCRQHKKDEELNTVVIEDPDFILRQIIEEEVYREIIQTIGLLPEERKKVIELYMAGLSQEEIARQLAISVNTVKTQKRKAYAFLKKELQNLFTLILLLT